MSDDINQRIAIVPNILKQTGCAIVLLVLACIGVGCVTESSPSVTPEAVSSTATSATPDMLTMYPTVSAVLGTVSPSPTLPPTPSPTATYTVTPPPSSTPSPTPTYTPSATPSPTMDPGMLQDTSIFYTCAPDFNLDALEAAEIWKIQADGTLRQQLFATEAVPGDWITWLSSLQLSQNGQTMAFIQFFTTREIMADASSLWVVNVDGSHPRELVGRYDLIPGSETWSEEDDVAFWRKPRPISPIWAPDSSRLAFVDALSIGVGEPGAVCILDVESGSWQAWGEGEVFDWSPDGSKLAIHSASRYAVTNDLQVVDMEGNTRSILELPPSIYLLGLDWSASTGDIVAQSRDLEKPDLLVSVIDPRDGSHTVVIEDRHVSYPQWSPDGKMISFVRSAEDTHSLYILDLDSGDMRMIMSQVHPPIVWSPDGHLVLVRSEVKGNGLYIVSVSSGQYWKIPALEDDEKMCFGSYTWLFPPQ